MGGHGGLNILPQKKWNVYNRDNRLKVARDEAKYDQRQQDLTEKHNAAEREHRRLALKERARERHGGAASINLDALEGGEGPRVLEGEVPVMTTSYQREQGARPYDGAFGEDPLLLSSETAAARADRLPPPLKRQKRDKTQEKKASKEQKHAPSLAELASQLDSAPPFAADAGVSQTEKAIVHTGNSNEAAAPKLEHFNLFAEEESRAKNPEKAAEQRLLLSKRGDVKTQTSNPRFDESFRLGYGLGGGGSDGKSGRNGSHSKSPWYVRHPSTLTAAAGGDGGGGRDSSLATDGQQRGATAPVSMIERWKEEGRAALIAAGKSNGKEVEEMSLLKGIKLIPKIETESEEEEEEKAGKSKQHRKKKERKESSRKESKKKDDDTWSKLREERLRREQEEQKRQNVAVRSATLGAGQHSGGGRRYNSTYGYGK